jgi:hypothetical protein
MGDASRRKNIASKENLSKTPAMSKPLALALFAGAASAATCKTTTCVHSAAKTHVYSKMLNNHGGSDMRAAKPERWHCQKGGGIEYTVKKYTVTVSIPGHATCHHNNAHDRIEH